MVFILINIFENLSTFLRERYKTHSSIIIPRPKINSQGYEKYYMALHTYFVCMSYVLLIPKVGRLQWDTHRIPVS